MRKPEQLFYDLIKKYLPGDISRIENTVDAGTPDLTCAAYGRDYWVELKSHADEDWSGKIEQILKWIEPSQRVWHARRSKVGSLIFVITKFRNYVVGLYAEGVNYNMAFEVVKLHNGYDWDYLKRMIRHHCDHIRLVF